MQIDVIQLGLIRTNCYLLQGERAAVVIDPGFESERTEHFLTENIGKERIILLTHAHFDHIGGAAALREKTGVKIGIGCNEADFLADAEQNLSTRFHAHLAPFTADITFSDGDEFSVGDLPFRVIETPGHTPGGMSYLSGDSLFSGDTLFYRSVGRTDFPGGDFNTLKAAVYKLFELDDAVKVYPGHDCATTIGEERKYNTII